jgi:pimeloyl-ACP methyl ester carboxylesterase
VSVVLAVVRVGDVDVAYDTRGSGVPMLLVSGFGMTRAMWDEAFCDALVAKGFQVVRMDNRDTGASTRLSALGVPDGLAFLRRSLFGLPVSPPYRLEDMAADALGVMTALGHKRFHVVGASMGGMIAQTLALDHADRLLSMTSIMSTPGGRRYSVSSPGALRGITRRLPKEPEAQVEHLMRVFRMLAGNTGPFEEARTRRLAESLVASKPSAAGSARQFGAIIESSARRRQRLSTIKTPTLVIHGKQDPLLPLRGAKAMSRLIPGAKLLLVEGMGHHFPSNKYGELAEAIGVHANRQVNPSGSVS